MKTITKEELQKVLENHLHWLNKDCDGWEIMKADLSNIDLSNMDLSGVDLSEADLRGADLSQVNLSEANLMGANLNGAHLKRATLRMANLSFSVLRNSDLSFTDLTLVDLRSADLSGAKVYVSFLNDADLREACLYNADLREACLYRANLKSADLRNALLRNANLTDANLYYVSLQGADLHNVNLSVAKNVPFVPFTCPDYGKFIGFKKAYNHSGPYIVVLEIPEDAKRLSAMGRECRCDRAKVFEIQKLDGGKADVEFVYSGFDSSFIYRVGETVSVDDFCEDRWKECSEGIHFFINREEAVNYR